MDFRSETVHHDEGLDFYFPVEAVSFDSFLCTLMLEEERLQGNFDNFLAAVIKTMVHMRSHSVDKIFDKIKEHKACPRAYELLMLHFDEIKDAVEAERQAITKGDKLR